MIPLRDEAVKSRAAKQALFKQGSLPEVESTENAGVEPAAAKGKSIQAKAWAWGEFIKVGENTYQCKHCSKDLTGSNVTRLQKHLLNTAACKNPGFLNGARAVELDTLLSFIVGTVDLHVYCTATDRHLNR